MSILRLFVIAILLISVSACSSKGASGAKSGDELGSNDFGDGNIPSAQDGTSALADVRFDYDSSELSSEARQTLSSNGQWLRQNSDQKVNVEGHCDERGTAEYNLALGERRARSAFDFLKSSGVAGSQMKIISYGEELPLDPGSSEAAWSKNRRVHFSAE